MGRRRNKEETIRKLIAAVGNILAEHGHTGIGVNKVALESGVSKPMIYQYFGGLNNLLKAYIQKKDYWLPYFETLELADNPTSEELKHLFIKILQDQFRYFYSEKEMQKLILWQASEYNALIRKISETREKEGVRLLEMPDDHFRNSGVSLKAVVALLVGGIYFMILQNTAGNGPVAGIDISDDKDAAIVLRTIEQIVQWAWDAAAKSKFN